MTGPRVPGVRLGPSTLSAARRSPPLVWQSGVAAGLAAFYIGTVPVFDERPTMGLLIYVGVVTALWMAYLMVAGLRYCRRLSIHTPPGSRRAHNMRKHFGGGVVPWEVWSAPGLPNQLRCCASTCDTSWVRGTVGVGLGPTGYRLHRTWAATAEPRRRPGHTAVAAVPLPICHGKPYSLRCDLRKAPRDDLLVRRSITDGPRSSRT